ncbi:MAG: amino acid adenylation domain-containing protein, partial [bacterium]
MGMHSDDTATNTDAAFSKNRLEGQAHTSYLSFWQSQLGKNPPVLELPTDQPRMALQTYQSKSHSIVLPESITESLERFGNEEDATPFTVLFSAFQVLLYRYTGQEDVIVATPFAAPARNGAGANGNHTKGANLVVLRTSLAGNPTFRQLLSRSRQIVDNAQAHNRLPIDQLIDELYADRDMHRYPLFHIVFALQESGQTLTLENGVPEIDLILEVIESGENLQAAFHFNADLFNSETIERLAGHYETILANVLENPALHIATLPMLTKKEHEQLLYRWNDTETVFPHEKCLHELFEQNVQHQEDAVAIRFADEQISYAELDRSSNQLAHYLCEIGVGPEIRVGISVERSVEMVVGILGILKAGGAYVPIDPAYPTERQDFMLTDSKVTILLTQQHLLKKMAQNSARILCLDADWEKIAETPQSGAKPQTPVEPDNLAYVIYTSGSTGRPKGIALRHRGVVNNIFDLNDSFGVGFGDHGLVISSLSFDMCVYEVLGMLAAGGTIVMPLASKLSDATHWADLVVQHGVTVWNSAPQLLEMLVNYTENRPELHPRSIRVTILGGDWVPVALPDRLKALAKDVNVIVLGGATESSIHSIVFPVEKTEPKWKSIPYGKPQRNQLGYILDANLQPLPIGVPGELHLGGIGLARGYFDRPDLTAEKFIPNPYCGVWSVESRELGVGSAECDVKTPNSPLPTPHSPLRIYKTGDLARWKADGNIELIGRMDHQVKIRGHRIELGEIMSVLKAQPGVEEAVVIAREDEPGNKPRRSHDHRGKRLVAYIVPASESAAAATESSAGSSEHHTEQISQWQSIYDDTYGQDSELKLEEDMNFAGWISSYTGLPFSEAELRETLDGSANRILALEPQETLEIGCGTGLILFKVAPHCTKYDGADLSPVVVEDLQRQIAQAGEKMQHVTVRQRLAEL